MAAKDPCTEESASSVGPGRHEVVLLYYQYTAIDDPHKLCDQQQGLCERLRLRGRIRIAAEG